MIQTPRLIPAVILGAMGLLALKLLAWSTEPTPGKVPAYAPIFGAKPAAEQKEGLGLAKVTAKAHQPASFMDPETTGTIDPPAPKLTPEEQAKRDAAPNNKAGLMNGTLVEARHATVPFLTAGFHYGIGVFEGIRAYGTARGPAVFRLRDHLVRIAAEDARARRGDRLQRPPSPLHPPRDVRHDHGRRQVVQQRQRVNRRPFHRGRLLSPRRARLAAGRVTGWRSSSGMDGPHVRKPDAASGPADGPFPDPHAAAGTAGNKGLFRCGTRDEPPSL